MITLSINREVLSNFLSVIMCNVFSLVSSLVLIQQMHLIWIQLRHTRFLIDIWIKSVILLLSPFLLYSLQCKFVYFCLDGTPRMDGFTDKFLAYFLKGEIYISFEFYSVFLTNFRNEKMRMFCEAQFSKLI